jgi:uncharacterized protein (DUF1778 family)
MQPARKPHQQPTEAQSTQRPELQLGVATGTDSAHQVQREQALFTWSERDQQAFAVALLAPLPPAPKLRAAAVWAREQASK